VDLASLCVSDRNVCRIANLATPPRACKSPKIIAETMKEGEAAKA
jgi:hypothetical protein